MKKTTKAVEIKAVESKTVVSKPVEVKELKAVTVETKAVKTKKEKAAKAVKAVKEEKLTVATVNNAETSIARFNLALQLLAEENHNFKIENEYAAGSQKFLVFNDKKIVYFTRNHACVTKSNADKVKVQAVKKYNHSYCYQVAVEKYSSYEDIVAAIVGLTAEKESKQA